MLFRSQQQAQQQQPSGGDSGNSGGGSNIVYGTVIDPNATPGSGIDWTQGNFHDIDN